MVLWSYSRGPELHEIKVGYACNNRCQHCAVDWVQRRLVKKQQRHDLTTDEITTLLDNAAKMNAHSVVLTGGEVTIRADFVYLVRYAVERHLSPIIHTNGRVFANKEMAAQVAELPGVSFVVSLHASRAEIHDRISGRIGSFDQTYLGLRNLCAFTNAMVTKLVLLKQNKQEVVPTLKLAKRLGVAEFCLAFPFAAPHQLPGVPRYREVAEEIREGCLYAEEARLSITFETIPYCVVGALPQMWKQSCDLARAERTNRIREDNTRSRSSRSDWDHLRPMLKVKLTTCGVCVFDRICEGPWGEYVHAFGFDEFAPVAPIDVEEFLLCDDKPGRKLES